MKSPAFRFSRGGRGRSPHWLFFILLVVAVALLLPGGVRSKAGTKSVAEAVPAQASAAAALVRAAKIGQDELDTFLAALSDPGVYRDPKRLGEFFSDDAVIVCELPEKVSPSRKTLLFAKSRFLHFLDKWQKALLAYSVTRKIQQEVIDKDGNAYVVSQGRESFGMFGIGLVQPVEEHVVIRRGDQGRLHIVHYEVLLR